MTNDSGFSQANQSDAAWAKFHRQRLRDGDMNVFSVARQRGNALLANVRRSRSYRITIEGATHSTFSDEEIISDPNADRPRELLDFTRTYLRAFFDEALRENESPLLNTAPADRAIQIETFSPR